VNDQQLALVVVNDHVRGGDEAVRGGGFGVVVVVDTRQNTSPLSSVAALPTTPARSFPHRS